MANTKVEDWDGKGTLPVLFHKSATGAVIEWQCWVEGPEVVVRWGHQNGNKQDARFRCEPKNMGRSNATTAEQQAVKEAISKWKKQVKKKYSETVGGPERVRPMLAHKFEDQGHKLVYPCWAQPKLDGVRCLAHRNGPDLVLQSRGNDRYNQPHIHIELHHMLHESMILDGELYAHGKSLQQINSLARKHTPESARLLRYHVFDCILVNQPELEWWERRRWLHSFFEYWGPNLQMCIEVPSTNIGSYDGLVVLQKGYVNEGFEGAIARNSKGVYRMGSRSSDLIKMKTWQEGEYRVIDWTVGRGKNENVPIFKLVTPDGKEFEAVPKGSAEDRLQMLREADSYIDKLMTVRFFDFTDEGKPHLATAIVLREDL